jgi:hypothetical protein
MESILNSTGWKTSCRKRPDLHAFLLLDRLVPGDHDMITAATHDEFFLGVSPESSLRLPLRRTFWNWSGAASDFSSECEVPRHVCLNEYYHPEQDRPHHPLGPSSLQAVEACPCYMGRSGGSEAALMGTLQHGVTETGRDDNRLDDDQILHAAQCIDFYEARRAALSRGIRGENGDASGSLG